MFQLERELAAAVLAPGQQRQRTAKGVFDVGTRAGGINRGVGARGIAGVVARTQTSASSATSSSTAVNVAGAFVRACRIRDSMSAAMAGCSFR